MFYNEILKKTLEKETNPVNKMYLHEINIKWQKILKAIENYKDSNKEIIDMFNIFRKAINEKKYKFNKLNAKGFTVESPIFSIDYINDLMSIIIKRQDIINHAGIFWGCERFNIHYSFSPKSFNSLEKTLSFNQLSSPEVLFLGQKIDLQYRVLGKRNFEKYKSILPLIVFKMYKILRSEEMLYLDHIAELSKNSFNGSKMIVIAEKLEKGFIPDIALTNIDYICVLTKENEDKILFEVVNELEKIICDIIKKEYKVSTKLLNKGIITR